MNASSKMVNGLCALVLFVVPVAGSGCAMQAAPEPGSVDDRSKEEVGSAEQAVCAVPSSPVLVGAPDTYQGPFTTGACGTDQTTLSFQLVADGFYDGKQSPYTELLTQCDNYCSRRDPACSGRGGLSALTPSTTPPGINFANVESYDDFASCYPVPNTGSAFYHRWIANCTCH